MVDSRAKGARNENLAKAILTKYTQLGWERIPSSGALDAKHGLKGDLYIPKVNNKYCVEVKAYKDEHLNSTILSSKDSQFHKWWAQAVRQGLDVNKEPLLLFKKDRGKWFIAFSEIVTGNYDWIFISKGQVNIALLEDWLQLEDITWTINQ